MNRHLPGGPNPALKILHICPRPSFSGLEAYAVSMAGAQVRLGHDVSMVVLEKSPVVEKCAVQGVKTLPLPQTTLAKVATTQRMLSSLFLGNQTPDIVHLHSTQDLDLVLWPLLVSRLRSLNGVRRPRVILQTHIWISHTKRDPLHFLSYSLVDEVWCSSPQAQANLARLLPIKSEKLRVIRYGRDVEHLSAGFLPRNEARQKLNLPNDALVVGTVARIDEGKGVRELLAAALKLMPENQNLHLIWIGPPTADDPKAVTLAQEIQKQLAALPSDLQSRVHFPGAVTDSYRLLKAFDLFALPTYSECFALSLLEAQLAGLPSLATNSGGSPAVVREGETGWLFEPRSESAASSALARAIEQKLLWKQFGEAAERQVRDGYDFAHVLPGTVSAYRELLASAGPRTLATDL